MFLFKIYCFIHSINYKLIINNLNALLSPEHSKKLILKFKEHLMPKNKAKNSATLIFYFPKGEVISLINFFLSNNAIPASAEL